MTDDSTDVTAEELEAWKEAHKHLTNAVLVAQEAVAAAKAQRRYWMEEICANLTPEGKLVNSSVWKKAAKAPRKTPAKRKQLGSEKPIMKINKRRRKTEETEEDDAKAKKKGTKKKKIRLHLKNPAAKARTDEEADAVAEVYEGEEMDDAESHAASAMLHLDPHQGVSSQAYHHPHSNSMMYMGPGKQMPPPPPPPPHAAMPPPPPADPYGMMHQHVPQHLRPYMAPAHPGMPPPAAPSAPSGQPMGAYASVLQQGGDTDETSSEGE